MVGVVVALPLVKLSCWNLMTRVLRYRNNVLWFVLLVAQPGEKKTHNQQSAMLPQAKWYERKS